MSKKMMEIIDHKMNLKNGTVSIKLLDTSFTQLSRTIGSVPGADWETVVAGDMLSKEMLVSLNNSQLDIKPRFENFAADYRAWIDTKKTFLTLEKFYFTFSSVVDYTDKYIVDKTVANYNMLTEIVSAEKEIYESGKYWCEANMLRNQTALKNWSKNRNYGNTVKILRGRFYVGGVKDTNVDSINSDGLTVTTSIIGSSRYIYISGLQNMTVGETRTVHVKAKGETETGQDRKAEFWFNIERQSLGTTNDDGTFRTWTSMSGGGAYDNSAVYSYTGNYSPHFDGSPSLPWFKQRVFK